MFAALNNFLTGSRVQTLQTYTFPGGTSTWTAPPGVTNLVSAAGKGADGSPSSSGSATNNNFIFVAQRDYASAPNAPYQAYTNIYNAASDCLVSINSGAPGTRAAPIITDRPTSYITSVISSDYWGEYPMYGNYWYGDSQTISGTFSLIEVNSPPAEGLQAITYANVNGTQRGWRISVPYDYTINATTGASTTGFSQTFPGGAGGAASTTTYTNVAVTPGTTYTVVNNGALTIQYYA
jgi:hypothetical protein